MNGTTYRSYDRHDTEKYPTKVHAYRFLIKFLYSSSGDKVDSLLYKTSSGLICHRNICSRPLDPQLFLFLMVSKAAMQPHLRCFL